MINHALQSIDHCYLYFMAILYTYLHDNVEGNIWKGLGTAVVIQHVFFRGELVHNPFRIQYKAGQVTRYNAKMLRLLLLTEQVNGTIQVTCRRQ